MDSGLEVGVTVMAGGGPRTTASATFELYTDKAGEYRWRLRHQNGNIIADSGEGYTTKASAINGIESVKENSAAAPISEQTS